MLRRNTSHIRKFCAREGDIVAAVMEKTPSNLNALRGQNGILILVLSSSPEKFSSITIHIIYTFSKLEFHLTLPEQEEQCDRQKTEILSFANSEPP